jgi:excisionase family DNA binding protein
MENIVFTQLSIPEVRQLLREELQGFFSEFPGSPKAEPAPDELLTPAEAAKLLHLSKQTIYAKVSAREIPFSKQGKRLYFSKAELTEWVKAGRRQTGAEKAAAANEFLKPKAGRNEKR